MDDCIFCLIAQGKIPSSKVYESEKLYAFLDLNPANKGHTLIIPKAHYKTILEFDSSLGTEVMEAMQKIAQAIIAATGAAGINIIQNNGRAAGQEVDHLHWHIIPRFAEDGFRLWKQKKYDSMDEMNAFAAKIRDQLGA